MDPTEKFLCDLEAPLRVVRLFALEEIIRLKRNPVIHNALEKRLAVEDDEECRMLIEHALEALPPPQPEELPQQKLLEEFASRLGATRQRAPRLALIDRLTRKQIQFLASIVPQLAAQETDPYIIAALVRKFSSTWPFPAIPLIEGFLQKDSLPLIRCAVEFLAERAPQRLVEALPAVLVMNDPRIRALAIKFLGRHDPDEAIEHLESMLWSDNPETRAAALQCGLFLPFSLIRNLWLKYLTVESDPILLDKAGIMFEVNPDLEVPPRLLEAASVSPAAKTGYFKNLIQASCRILPASGLLKIELKDYMARLQRWGQERGAVRYVQELLGNLEMSSDAPYWASVLQASRKNPFLMQTITKALEWPIDERQKEFLRALKSRLEGEETVVVIPSPVSEAPPQISGPESSLGDPKTGSHLSDSKKPPAATEKEAEKTENVERSPQQKPLAHISSVAELDSLSLEEQIRTVSGFSSLEENGAGMILRELFTREALPPALSGALLRAGVRLGANGGVECARKALQTGDQALIAAALEYLGEFDADGLFPILGSYLMSDKNRIKAAALKVLRRYDPKQALSSLQTLIRSGKPDQINLALGCMVHFEFSLLREILASLLRSSPPDEAFERVLLLFENNPEPENLYVLFRAEGEAPTPKRQEHIAHVQGKNREMLIAMERMTEAEANTLVAGFPEKLAAEKKKRATPPPYSRRVLAEKKACQEPTSFLGELWQVIAASPSTYGLSVVVILAFLLQFFVLSPMGSVDPKKAETAGPVKNTKAQIIEGVIDNITSQNCFITTKAGVSYLSSGALPHFAKQLKVGDQVRVEVVPFRRSPEGFLICRVNRISRLPPSGNEKNASSRSPGKGK